MMRQTYFSLPVTRGESKLGDPRQEGIQVDDRLNILEWHGEA